MGSVFSQLIDTLPFHLALNKMRTQTGHSIAQASVNDVRTYLQKLPNTGHRNQLGGTNDDMPPVPGPAESSVTRWARDLTDFHYHGSGPPPERLGWDRLWGWTQGFNSPVAVSDVRCRVREYGYHAYKVFDRIEFGLYAGSSMRPAVKIWSLDGHEIELSLAASNIHSRWLIKDGYAGQNTHWLWPLEATLDTGVVVAYAFNLSYQNYSYIPRVYNGALGDPESWRALRELSSSSSRTGWGQRALQGNFMPIRSHRHRPSREVGRDTLGDRPETPHAVIRAPRVLVLVCFSTLRERTDFDPGGIASVAKVFPQIMVKCTIPLAGMEAAIKMRRPTRTTVQQRAGGRGQNHSSCHNESENNISPLMVTDVNINRPQPSVRGVSLPEVGPTASITDFGPHWCDIFAYYEDDHSRMSGRIHVVNTNKWRRTRTLPNYGVRHLTSIPPVLGSDETSLIKVRHQGEFDNIHLAPTLRLNATHYALGFAPQQSAYNAAFSGWSAQIANQRLGQASGIGARIPIRDRSQLKLDDIPMAPFCTHDCLHTHWRWGEFLSLGKRFVKGWSSTRPYARLGAPMVQPQQDVYIRLPDAHTMVYEVEIRRRRPRRRRAQDPPWPHRHREQIQSFEWQVVNHHGSAYVTSISGTNSLRAARASVSFEREIHFFNGANAVDPMHSSAAHYWHMQYSWDNNRSAGQQVFERVELSPSQRRTARRF